MNVSHQRRRSLEWSGGLIHWSFVTSLSDQQDLTYINSFVADEDAGEQQTNEPVRHLQTFGFRSRPPVNSEIISVSVAGSGSQKVAIASDNMELGPSDIKEGESVVYSKGGSTILLDKDGNIIIKAASGKDVTVNGGTLNVARKTDKVIADTSMLAWIGNVTNALGTLGQVVMAPTDFGVINGGADHFKG